MKTMLVVGMTDTLGGMESVIMNNYRLLDKTKVSVDFLCVFEHMAFEEEVVALGGKVFHIDKPHKHFFKFYKNVKKIIRNKYDIIWYNTCSLANISYLKIAKKFGVKVRIIHAHNSKNPDSKLKGYLHNFNRRKIAKCANYFWSCSQEASDFFYNKKIMANPNYRIINNAIDLPKFRFNEKIREEVREELGLKNELVIGHVGRFHFQKNHEFLINVFNEIHSANHDAKLLLIGKGENRNKIIALVEKLNLKNNVLFLGERTDVNRLFSCMDIFVMPSLFEGLPVVLIEAQANGLPIVASDVVSKQSKILDNFKFLSLQCDGGIKTWGSCILGTKTDINNRINAITELDKKGFNINNLSVFKGLI